MFAVYLYFQIKIIIYNSNITWDKDCVIQSRITARIVMKVLFSLLFLISSSSSISEVNITVNDSKYKTWISTFPSIYIYLSISCINSVSMWDVIMCSCYAKWPSWNLSGSFECRNFMFYQPKSSNDLSCSLCKTVMELLDAYLTDPTSEQAVLEREKTSIVFQFSCRRWLMHSNRFAPFYPAR